MGPIATWTAVESISEPALSSTMQPLILFTKATPAASLAANTLPQKPKTVSFYSVVFFSTSIKVRDRKYLSFYYNISKLLIHI